MWACERRRRAREVQLVRELEERLKKPSKQLALAAGSVAPQPTAWIKLQLEEPVEVSYVAGSNEDISRLTDWLFHGRYQELAEEAVLALKRDAARC